MTEIILPLLLHLWPYIIVPMVPLALIRRAGRAAFFLLGIAFFFGFGFLQGPQGPDSYGLIIPFYGLAVSLAAVLAEIPAFFVRRWRLRRAAGPADSTGPGGEHPQAGQSGHKPAAKWDDSLPNMLVAVDADLLAEAFPGPLRGIATQAAGRILSHLSRSQWTDRFEVNVGADPVSIPYRLRFSSCPRSESEEGAIHLVGQCLESRSNDGFQRQRAVRALLADIQPWSAPFITALIGEYLTEILHDIHDALEPRSAAVLAEFISANPRYWRTVRNRVMSYWNVYYRADFRRCDYVGFRLIDALEDAVRARES